MVSKPRSGAPAPSVVAVAEPSVLEVRVLLEGVPESAEGAAPLEGSFDAFAEVGFGDLVKELAHVVERGAGSFAVDG